MMACPRSSRINAVPEIPRGLCRATQSMEGALLIPSAVVASVEEGAGQNRRYTPALMTASPATPFGSTRNPSDRFVPGR
jgi:hypothetical protein